MRILKYLISGGIGITVNLLLYRILVTNAHFGYLLGSVVAVSCSTVLGFLLQKFWTFEDRSRERAPVQFGLYACIAAGNIVLNTGIVYPLIKWMGLFYLVAQALAAATVALWSFFLYREFIFKSSVRADLPLQ